MYDFSTYFRVIFAPISNKFCCYLSLLYALKLYTLCKRSFHLPLFMWRKGVFNMSLKDTLLIFSSLLQILYTTMCIFKLARRNPVPQYTRIVQLNCDIILQKNENSTTIPPNDLGTAPMLW